jgi:hypothetical protein
MSRRDISAMCRDHYDPRRGARSITVGWIENQLASEVADILLRHPEAKGVIEISYDGETRQIRAQLTVPGDTPASANHAESA